HLAVDVAGHLEVDAGRGAQGLDEAGLVEAPERREGRPVDGERPGVVDAPGPADADAGRAGGGGQVAEVVQQQVQVGGLDEAGGEERPAVGGPECGGDHRPVAAAPQVVEDVVDVVDRQRAEVVEGRRHVRDPGVTLPGPHPQAGG